MGKYKPEREGSPEEETTESVLEEVMREGARKLLQMAIENEVEEFLTKNECRKDGDGRRLAVRNGYLPDREILTGLGPIKIKQPRKEMLQYV